MQLFYTLARCRLVVVACPALVKCSPMLFGLAESVNDNDADLPGDFAHLFQRLQRAENPIHWNKTASFVIYIIFSDFRAQEPHSLKQNGIFLSIICLNLVICSQTLILKSTPFSPLRAAMQLLKFQSCTAEHLQSFSFASRGGFSMGEIQ